MITRLNKRLRAPLLGASFVSLLCMQGVASAEVELEPNDTKAQAQTLSISSAGATVTGTIGDGSGSMTTDLDLYAFEARAGDVPNITIVSDNQWDTFLGLYDSAGNLLEMNDDAYPMNLGSVSPFDSRIDTYRIDADGTYYVAVTPIPRYLGANFSVIYTSPTTGGAYDLTITGISPTLAPVSGTPTQPSAPVQTPVVDPSSPAADARVVTIQVRHWAAEDNEAENRRYKKLIPVAIMSAPGFDAMTIDQDSLAFGATGSEESFARCRKHGKDINRDGRRDLVCYFKTDLTGFDVGDVQGYLNGTTASGEAFQGSAALKIFSVAKNKHESWHKRHNLDPNDERSRPNKRKNRRNKD
jgi:hypothetical protein